MTLDDFPTTRPVFTANFARSRQMPPQITFSRASTGTSVGENGLVQTATNNTPRFNWKDGKCQGLLIEESRTNSCIFSENFTGTNWSSQYTTVTASATTAPDGTNTASSLMETADNNEHRLTYQTISSTINCTSIFVKPNGRENVAIRILYGGNGWMTAVYNLTGDGSVTQVTQGSANAYTELDSDIISLSNGWYRISLTTQLNLNPPNQQYPILLSTCTSSTPTLSSSLGVELFAGDTSKGVYIWGAQFELEKSFPTSYIPTSGSTATRAPDLCQITGTDFDFFNQSEFTLVSDTYNSHAYGTAASNAYLAYIQSDTTNYHSFVVHGSTIIAGSNSYVKARTGSTNQSIRNSSANRNLKAAWGIGSTIREAHNGVLQSDFESSNNGMPVCSEMSIGHSLPVFAGTAWFNGTIRRLSMYPTRVSDDALEALTQ